MKAYAASFANMQAKLAEEMADKGVQDVTNRQKDRL